MKTTFVSTFILFSVVSINAQPEYAKPDSIAQAFHEQYTDASELALKLSEPFSTGEEKARAIFSWIAFNIRYDYKQYKDPKPKTRVGGRTPQELQKNMQEWQENEIRNTLRSKKGVCADYSRLFRKMCGAAGLECVTVSGVTRKPNGKGGKHAWNAVRIGEKWQLVDATWGAGYVNDEEERFVRRFTPAFFFTNPALFILHHLPDDDKWQLLDKPVSKKDFDKQPMVDFSHPDFTLEAFSPENGKIVPAKGPAEIRLKFGEIPEVFVVAAGKNREIPARVEKKDDGWVVLTFSPGSASEISVFVGKSRRKTLMLARFSVE